MLPTQLRLNELLIKWDAAIKEFAAYIDAYGERKADLEHRRAVVAETAKIDNPKLSQAAAERAADADEDAYRMHKAFRAAESSVAAMKERLKWFQACADALRSEIATDREERKLYATHGGDA